MTTPQRNASVVSAYNYAVGAFLEWLQETHDFRAPSWWTVGVMGYTTLSPQGKLSIQMILHTRHRRKNISLVPVDNVVGRSQKLYTLHDSLKTAMNTMSKGGQSTVPSYVPSLLESNQESILSLPRVLKGRLIEFLSTAV